MTPLQRHYDAVSALGCIACRKDGVDSPAELHHPYGRKGANEWRVIPICAAHHRGGVMRWPSLHPWKRAFHAKYGSAEELLAEVEQLTAG